MQAVTSIGDPGQLSPPFLGAGNVHVLVLVCIPAPQLLLHVLHVFQTDHDPSTGDKMRKQNKIKICNKIKSRLMKIEILKT